MYYLYFIIIFIIIIFLIFKLYIKIKYNFWSNQPVFHKYNLLNWIYKRGIINDELPKSNRYCNFYNIIVSEYNELEENIIKEIIELLQKKKHYLESEKLTSDKKNIHFNYSLLTIPTFTSYFIGCNSKSFISTYRTKHPFDFKDGIEKTLPYAIMTTRPLNITLKNTQTFKIYYIDFLSVHYDYKDTDVFKEIFQTHEYIQRYKNKNIKVLLYKPEEIIPGIVPFIYYNNYLFIIKQLPKPVSIHTALQLIEINKQNIRLLITLIYKLKNKFDCFIIPDLTNLINLITTGIYYVYGIIEKDTLISCYFFRKSLKQDNTIICFASISNCYNKLFLTGFSMAKNKFDLSLILIENISHNNIIINNLVLLNIIPKYIDFSYYYLYNYLNRQIIPEKIFILI